MPAIPGVLSMFVAFPGNKKSNKNFKSHRFHFVYFRKRKPRRVEGDDGLLPYMHLGIRVEAVFENGLHAENIKDDQYSNISPFGRGKSVVGRPMHSNNTVHYWDIIFLEFGGSIGD